MSSSVPKQYGCSEVRAIHFEYEWTIKNLRDLPQGNGESIYSPIFSATENDGAKWRLQLFPKGESYDDINKVALFLCLCLQNAAKTRIKVHYELSIIKSERLIWKQSFIYTYETLTGYGRGGIIETSSLLNSPDSDNSITIRCKIYIPHGVITKTVSKLSENQGVHPVSCNLQGDQLNEHFPQFFEDSRFCDVTIIVGEEKFTAHKLVLAARSTVFAAMFEHKEMEENRKNEVKIEDLEPATVKGMLEFIYTDKVTELETLARELLRASDKYDLHRLRTMCEEVLYKTLTIDNAAEILVLSDLHRSQTLKEHVMAFIAGHLLGVTQSESFKSMVGTHSTLLGELICAIAVHKESQA